MKVLLMDLDVIKERHPFPNLALMKLSAYHKAKGDEVYLNFPLCLPDLAYASCVFSWNRGERSKLQKGAIIGGSGIDLKAELPSEIEHIMPDYTLYPQVEFSLGFTSRGCSRKCPWCIVPDKEGGIREWAEIDEFWARQHKKIMLLDNNLLASPNWKHTLERLTQLPVEVDFNQGLDIRLVNEDNVDYLRRIRTKQLRFAFDHISYENAVKRGITLLLNNGIRSRKLSFYVLVGFNGDKTAVERMKILHSYNVDIYPMLYKGVDGKEPLSSQQSLRQLREILQIEGQFWHGARNNLRKFVRNIVTGGL